MQIETERNVIGSILLKPGCYPEVARLLRPRDFEDRTNRHIFAEMTRCYAENTPIDIILLAGRLDKEMPEIYVRLAEALDSVATARNVSEYAEQVRANSQKKEIEIELRQAANKIKQAVSPLEIKNIGQAVQNKLRKIMEATLASVIVTASEYTENVAEKLNTMQMEGHGITGLCTGLDKIDEYLGGLQTGDYIVLAGRPSQGKTSLANTIALNVAQRAKQPIYYCSLDTANQKLYENITCNLAGISASKYRCGHLDQWENDRFWEYWNKVKELPIITPKSRMLRPLDIRYAAETIKSEKGLGLIIVDYLQLMTEPVGFERKNDNSRFARISAELKAIACDLAVPMLLLSQLSRKVEERGDKIPQLSDLRDTGALEQDADIVIFLMRPEFYWPKQVGVWNDKEKRIVVTAQKTICKIAKDKQGSANIQFGLKFEAKYLRLENASPEWIGENNDQQRIETSFD